jgi:hypothetical protein
VDNHSSSISKKGRLGFLAWNERMKMLMQTSADKERDGYKSIKIEKE